MTAVFNFNVGVVGHVDSGKTTLVKALSTTGSTAAFDKHPQSQERGITLDLGFSSFAIDAEASAKVHLQGSTSIQYTLVDCPGHASLLRTVIGGSSIIDLFILVIDAAAGIQTQTAECIVVAEITKPGRLLVALNKVDLIPEAERAVKVEKVTKRIFKVLGDTSFKNAPIVPVSAATMLNLEALKDELLKATYMPLRSSEGIFLLSVDHCFSLKGQGTVLTGTVLSGKVKVGDTVEIAHANEQRKLKSIQMFKKPVQSASQGDRVGICVSQLDASNLERCLVCAPGSLLRISGGMFSFSRVQYFKNAIRNRSKFHISIGHELAMGTCYFFATSSGANVSNLGDISANSDFEWFETVPDAKTDTDVMVFVDFSTPVLCTNDCLMIASKLDADVNAKACRLAFHGRLLIPVLSKDANGAKAALASIRQFKNKERSGMIERRHDERTLIATGLFKKETDLTLFQNMRVTLSTGEGGIIEGGFGSSGKVKIRLTDDLTSEANVVLDALGAKRKRNDAGDTADVKPLKVFLRFRKYVFAEKNKMVQ